MNNRRENSKCTQAKEFLHSEIFGRIKLACISLSCLVVLITLISCTIKWFDIKATKKETIHCETGNFAHTIQHGAYNYCRSVGQWGRTSYEKIIYDLIQIFSDRLYTSGKHSHISVPLQGPSPIWCAYSVEVFCHRYMYHILAPYFARHSTRGQTRHSKMGPDDLRGTIKDTWVGPTKKKHRKTSYISPSISKPL